MGPYLARHERISFAMRPLESYSGIRVYVYFALATWLYRERHDRAFAGPKTFTHRRPYLRASLSRAERDSGYWIVARAKCADRDATRTTKWASERASERSIDRRRAKPRRLARRNVSRVDSRRREYSVSRSGASASGSGKYRRGIIRQNPRICPKCILVLFPACYWNLSTTPDPVRGGAVETCNAGEYINCDIETTPPTIQSLLARRRIIN